MSYIIFLTVIFSLAGAATTVLLGDRNILSGNLFSWNKFFSIIFHWRFIIAMLSAFVARYSFMAINNALLKIPEYASNSTNITGFILSIATIFVIIANYIFLGEKLNVSQFIGAFLIIAGVWFVLR